MALHASETAVEHWPAASLVTSKKRRLAPRRRRQRRGQSQTKSCAATDSTTCCSVAQAREVNLTLYGLASPETRLVSQVVDALDDMKLQHCWFAFIPSRLGYSVAVDAAADALSKGHRYYRHGRNDELAYHAAIRSYDRAIRRVQICLDHSEERYTDATVLAIALLTHYEILVRNDRRAYCTHWSGVSALLCARPRSCRTSELVRAIFYSMWDQSFRTPCTAGITSPFEQDRFLDLDPVSLRVLPEATVRLRKLSQQLLIRLPRLIASVRDMKSQRKEEFQDFKTLLELAIVVSKLRDEGAENDLLHRVNVRKTEDSVDRLVIPHHFNFPDLEHMTTAVLYWHGRLTLINLCLKAMDTGVIAPRTLFTLAATNKDILASEQARLTVNILMAWPYASTQGDFGTVTMMQALIAVWGSMADRAAFQGMPIVDVRDWILLRFHETLAKEPGFLSSKQLNAVSDQLAGGPVADWQEVMGLSPCPQQSRAQNPCSGNASSTNGV